MTQENKKFFGIEAALLAAHTMQMHFACYYELLTTLTTHFYSFGGGHIELSVHHDFKDYVEQLPYGFVYSSMRSKDLENEDGKWRATTFEFDF